MNKAIKTIQICAWDEFLDVQTQQNALLALEQGSVVYIPNLAFSLQDEELAFLTPEVCDKSAKNISYDINSGQLRGSRCQGAKALVLQQLMARYAQKSYQLLEGLFPHYQTHLKPARTSYRPVEIFGRKAASYRKDDTLLHVDAFPSTPIKGDRILRVFTNVNPHQQSRIWKVGEPFSNVVQKFAPEIKKPYRGMAYLQQLLNITRGYRTLYDHYMLEIHNTMKGNASYQKNVMQTEVHFPPGSTWIVYTDQVSHAALSGQYVFEQTFHMPVQGLWNEATSPLRVLEQFLNRSLV